MTCYRVKFIFSCSLEVSWLCYRQHTASPFFSRWVSSIKVVVATGCRRLSQVELWWNLNSVDHFEGFSFNNCVTGVNKVSTKSLLINSEIRPVINPFSKALSKYKKRKGRSMSPKNASVSDRMFLEPRGFSLNIFSSFKLKSYTRVIVYWGVLLWNLIN
jgi:hypothetical protein